MISALFSILLGFSTLLSQIVILREVFSQCGGNEVVYGMGLGLWLLFGGLGALGFTRRENPSWMLIDALEFAIPFLALLSVFFTRGARVIMGVLPGEAPPFPFILVVTSLPLVLPSLAGGMLFRELSLVEAQTPHPGKSRVFFFEAVGASFAGALSLVPYLIKAGPFFLLSLCFLASSAAILLVRHFREGRQFPFLFHFFLLLASFFFLFCSGFFDSLSSSWSFLRFNHGFYTQTLNGRFDVTTDGDQKSFYTNLQREYVSNDPVFSEELVHFPSSFTTAPRRFLFIGADLLPLVQECEKYGDVSVSVIDGDYLHAESVIDQIGNDGLREMYIPEDPVLFFNGDEKKYDVIILSPGLPVTLSSLRTLRPPFYRKVAGALSEAGVVFVRLPFGGDYIGEDYIHIMNFVHGGLRSAFGGLRVIPGGEFAFIASLSEWVQGASQDDIVKRLRSRQLRNVYLVPEIIPFLMDVRKEAWARSLLTGEGGGGLTDSLPVIYGLSSVFSKHKDIFDRLIVQIFKIDPLNVLLLLLLFYALFFLFSTTVLGSGLAQAILFFSGALGILVEVSLIFAFQMAFGSVYTHIGLLFCSYMVGLAAGSSGALRGLVKASLFMLVGTLLAAVLLLWVFGGAASTPPSPLFYCALLITGAGGGGLFAASGERYGSYSRAYALDLAGSSSAAFTGSSILIPLCGVLSSSLVIFAISLLVITTSFSLSSRS